MVQFSREIDMTSHAIRHIETAALSRCAAFLQTLAQRLRAAAGDLDTWLESRRRANATRLVLNASTDRELRDIGLTRSDIEAIATGNPSRMRVNPTS
jgi:uncharacterized protein YjiS (DUF1127 family)